MKIEKSSSEQAHRIIKLLELFNRQNAYTSDQLLIELSEEYSGLSLRTIQRDLKILAQDGKIELEKNGREYLWKRIDSFSYSQAPLKISSNEMLSFYALKAYLNTFHGTSIEKDIITLTNKIENYAPGEAFLEEELYWDKRLGNYDYSNKHFLISRLLKFINEKTWINIEYEKSDVEIRKTVEVFPKAIYSYSGTMYLIAFRNDYKKFVSFTVHNIINTDESYKLHKKEPLFDYYQFQLNRFAVFDGVPTKVKLKIKSNFVKYFENRTWHITQNISYYKDNMILEMNVPITPDLISWICYWNRAITVKEPESLKNEVIKALKDALNNY